MLRCGTCQGRDADHRSGGPRYLQVAEKPANILSPRGPYIQPQRGEITKPRPTAWVKMIPQFCRQP